MLILCVITLKVHYSCCVKLHVKLYHSPNMDMDNGVFFHVHSADLITVKLSKNTEDVSEPFVCPRSEFTTGFLNVMGRFFSL